MAEEDRHPQWFTDLADEAKRVQKVRVWLAGRTHEQRTTGEAALLREIAAIVEK